MARPDTLDDRYNYQRETVAAAHYLKDLYGSDAQGSGLLVMACYNWGEDYVLPLVRSMPMNPRDRNFWMLLQKHRDKIPKETYDYVFYIVSAAVIGENPRLFGFNFDNPLANLNAQTTANAELRRVTAARLHRLRQHVPRAGLVGVVENRDQRVHSIARVNMWRYLFIPTQQPATNPMRRLGGARRC
jgi:hypothetical protein